MKNSNRSFLSNGHCFSFFLLFILPLTLLLFSFLNAFAEDMGPALRFTSPEQRVEIAPFQKAPYGTFTIEFRMKIEKVGSGLQNLVGDGEGLFDYCSKIYFNGDDQKLYAFLQTTSGTIMSKSTATIEPGLWYHVAYVADGTKLTMYLSGEIIVQFPYSGDLDNTDNAFYIGSDENEKAPLATIDEVRIWNTVRNEGQITYYMFRKIPPGSGQIADLGAYWRFNEGAGDTAIDATDNQRDGMFRGTPKWVELEACNGDFNEDTLIDGSDLASFATVFGQENCGSEGLPCPGDFNADGSIDELDLSEFASCFGRDDCSTRHVFAIVDVMVAEHPYAAPKANFYTGLRFGECTGPYIPNIIGYPMEAVDVNTGIGGSTTGIWAKYAQLPVNWAGPVLVDIIVKHWAHWTPICASGWVRASGTSSGIQGALTTGTDGPCWRNGLCVRYEPLSESDTFISNLCLSYSDGVLPTTCESNGGIWMMQSYGLDIHRNCGDSRYVYLGHNHAAKSMQPMPNYSDEEKYALLKTYAPRVWFKENERYWPSSVEWAFPFEEG